MLLFFENRLVFPARRYPRGDWNPTGLQFEDVFFESSDGTRLHGWYLDHPQPKAHLLYCHGNGEHVADLADLLALLQRDLDLAVFAFDYRGYGRSEGSAHEAGVLLDGRAAQTWLAERAGLEQSDLVLMGRSLGGAVAVDLAATNGARGLVLESTFTSLPDVASRLYRWAPVRLLMKTQFDSVNQIRQYEGQLLQSHGTADTLVPIDLGRRLFAAAPGASNQLIELEELEHNDPQPAGYYRELTRFLSELR